MSLPILSAILGIIAFLPINFYPAGFVFLVPLFVFFAREQKFWRLIFGAFIFKLVFFLGTIYFTLEPFAWGSGLLIFTGLPISVWLTRKLTKRSNATLILLPFFWTLFDLLHARYSLLPAYAIAAGNALGSSPFLGLAVFGGPAALIFFAAVVNVLIAAIIIKFSKENTVPAAFIGAIVIFIFLGWQISNFELKKNSSDYSGLSNSLKLAVVSVNEKFAAGQFDSLKRELAAERVDFIVFPEDIVDVPAGKSFSLAQNTAQELKVDLLATFDTTRGNSRYNSAVLFDNQGSIAGQRDKNRLTFIGEYWPFGQWHPFFFDWLKKSDPILAGYVIFNPQNPYFRGDRQTLLIARGNNTISFASPICLEIQYPADLKEYKKNGARFIANPTSNRWLGLGIEHFLYLTNNLRKIEAVWLKIPIISSGVKDFAGIITPDGKINFVNYESKDKNYGLLVREIRY